mgnify:CR=1 FL=1
MSTNILAMVPAPLATLGLDIGGFFETIINWLETNLAPVFDGIGAFIEWVLDGIELALMWPHWGIIIAILVALAWKTAGWRVALFSVIGLLLVVEMHLWHEAMETLALIGTSVIIALVIAVPVGIWSSKSDTAEMSTRTGAHRNTGRSAFSGITSSFWKNLSPSAMSCAQPYRPPAK